MLQPIKSSTVIQNEFLQTYQQANQNISEYVGSLQTKITNCKFTVKCECDKEVSAATLFLRAQFIRGIHNEWIREQLLQIEDSSFDDVVKKAISLEARKIDNKQLGSAQPSSYSNSQTNINQVKSQHNSRFSKRSNYQSKKLYSDRNSSQNRNRSQSRYQVDYAELGIKGLCFHCGGNSHKSSECRTQRDQLKCTSCRKLGHVSKVCITSLINKKNTSKINNYRSTSNKNPNSSHHVDETETYFISQIEPMIVDIYDEELIQPTFCDTKKYIARFLIEGKPINLEIDSGAGFTLIPHDVIKQLKLNAPIQPTNIFFRSYDRNFSTDWPHFNRSNL